MAADCWFEQVGDRIGKLHCAVGFRFGLETIRVNMESLGTVWNVEDIKFYIVKNSRISGKSFSSNFNIGRFMCIYEEE